MDCSGTASEREGLGFINCVVCKDEADAAVRELIGLTAGDVLEMILGKLVRDHMSGYGENREPEPL